MNFTSLSQLNPSSLDRLAALHQAVLHSLLADLGLPMVRRYYEICRQVPFAVGVCVVAPDDEVVGWAVGSRHPDQINSRLRQRPLWFAGQMLRLAMTRPGVLVQLAQSVLSHTNANRVRPGQLELTYIGVASSARGQGLGAALLEAFVETARTAGCTSVVLSVETDNPQAVALYSKAGFEVIATFKEGRFERHRMELPL